MSLSHPETEGELRNQPGDLSTGTGDGWSPSVRMTRGDGSYRRAGTLLEDHPGVMDRLQLTAGSRMRLAECRMYLEVEDSS